MFGYNSVYAVDKVFAFLDCMDRVFTSTSAWEWRQLPEVVCYHEYEAVLQVVEWLQLGQMIWPVN